MSKENQIANFTEEVYEEDLRKDFYTKGKVFWGKRKSLKLSDGSLYIYRTTLRVTEDTIEVYDFEDGLGNPTDFSIAKDEPEYENDISSLLVDIDRLESRQDNMDSILFTKRHRQQWRKEFLEEFAQITSKLMDLYNAICDI